MVKDRHLELSSMFIEMGRALMAEGTEKGDFVLSQAGVSMIAMSGLMLDDKNMFLFSQMCGLFSSKMIVDARGLTNSARESYEDLIKRINKIRKENGKEPLDE